MLTYDSNWFRNQRVVFPMVYRYNASTTPNAHFSSIMMKAQGSVKTPTLNETDIISFKISESMCMDEDYTIGNCITNTLEMVINNIDGKFTSTDFVNEHISVLLNIMADDYYPSASASLGHFITTDTKVDVRKKQISIKGVDLLTYYGSNTLVSDVGLPYSGQSLKDYTQRLCDKLGLVWTAFPDGGSYSENLNIGGMNIGDAYDADNLPSVSVKLALAHAAALFGKNMVLNRDGDIEFRTPLGANSNPVPIYLTNSNYYSSNVSLQKLILLDTPLTVSSGESSATTFGTLKNANDTRPMVIIDNYLLHDKVGKESVAAANRQTIINYYTGTTDSYGYYVNVFSNMRGMYPFKMSLQGNPTLEVGRFVYVYDDLGSSKPSYIESLVMTYEGSFKTDYETKDSTYSKIYGPQYNTDGTLRDNGPIKQLTVAIGGATVKVAKTDFDTFKIDNTNAINARVAQTEFDTFKNNYETFQTNNTTAIATAKSEAISEAISGAITEFKKKLPPISVSWNGVAITPHIITSSDFSGVTPTYTNQLVWEIGGAVNLPYDYDQDWYNTDFTNWVKEISVGQVYTDKVNSQYNVFVTFMSDPVWSVGVAGQSPDPTDGNTYKDYYSVQVTVKVAGFLLNGMTPLTLSQLQALTLSDNRLWINATGTVSMYNEYHVV